MKIKKVDYKIYEINELEVGRHTKSIKEFDKSNIVLRGYLPIEIINAFNNYGHHQQRDFSSDILNSMSLEESLNNIKTLYRFPKISLSRDKVKLWTDKNNAKVIRNADIADIKIFSEKQLKSLLNDYWSINWMTKEEFLDSLVEAQKDFSVFKKNIWEEVFNMISELDDDSLIIKEQDYYYSNNTDTPWSRSFEKWTYKIKHFKTLENLRCWVNINNWKDFCATRTGSFMLDSTANKLMSTDSVTFNDEMYLNVKDMIKSGISEDITVAMTTIANCHIEESRTYLALLFFHYNENYFKRQRFYNSVSFKSVRTGFQKYADLIYGHSSVNVYDTLMNHLIDDKALTVNAMEHLLDLVFENVIMGSTGMTDSKSFTIKRASISLTPEALEKVNKRPNKDLTREILEIQNEMIDLPF